MMFQFSRAVRHDPEYIKKRQALEEQMKNQIAKLNDEKHLRKVYRQQKKMNNVLLKKNLSEQLTAIEQMAEQDHMVNQFFRKKPKPYNRNVPVTPENIEGRISKGENIPFHIAQRVFDLAVKREVKGDPAARLEVKSVKRNVTWKDVHNVILKDPKYNKDDVYNSLVPKVMTSFEKLRIATNKAKAPIPLEIVKSFELDLHKALIQERPRNENDLTQMTTLMRNFALVADSKLSADPPITELKGFIQPYILLINLAALTNISHLVTILSHLVHFGMKLPLDLGTYELVVKNLMSQLQFPKLFVFLKEAEGVRGLVGTTHLYKHVYEQIKSRVSSPVRFPSAIDLYHYQQGYDDLLEILTTRGILNQVVPNAEIRMMSHYFKSHDVDTKKRMNKFLEGDENDDDDTAFTDEFKAWLAKNEKANVLESAKNKK
ncbi:hypothetical protein AKO1_007654 [Acrasis kona]|uniref:Uncharacterized protein n=1 Tax=Acrasis kona TaxID=1008807 RepID=A0AAW2YTI1_9EUKA